MLNLIVKAFAYYLPAYFTNAGFLLVGTLTRKKSFLISVKWFGSHKGFDSLFFAICCGGAIGLLVSSFTLGVFLGIGAWLGALGGSFLKRRFGIKNGDPAPLLDQLDFIIGSTLVGCFVTPPKIEYLMIIIIMTPFIHRATNIIAYKLGIKDVPY